MVHAPSGMNQCYFNVNHMVQALSGVDKEAIQSFMHPQGSTRARQCNAHAPSAMDKRRQCNAHAPSGIDEEDKPDVDHIKMTYRSVSFH